MTVAEALELTQAANVRISLVGDRIRYQSRGEPPAQVLAALAAAKPQLVALLGSYALSKTAALIGDEVLLADLARLDFRVRRYGNQAGLDDDSGQGRAPPMPLVYAFADRQHEYGLALRALGAPDMLAQLVEMVGPVTHEVQGRANAH
jgi:hypothetical protein